MFFACDSFDALSLQEHHSHFSVSPNSLSSICEAGRLYFSSFIPCCCVLRLEVDCAQLRKQLEVQTLANSKYVSEAQQRYTAVQLRATELEQSLTEIREQLKKTEEDRCRLNVALAKMTDEGSFVHPSEVHMFHFFSQRYTHSKLFK